MSDRDATLTSSIAGSTWASWHQELIDSDASTRRYFRLRGPENQTAILVDAPPNVEDYNRFLSVGDHLQVAGLCVPAALFKDFKRGVFVISDLGPTSLAKHLDASDKSDQAALDAILDILLSVRDIQLPDAPSMDHQTAIKMLEPLFAFYGADAPDQLEDAIRQAFDEHVAKETVLSLRDFHAENLIWREHKPEKEKLGVLDFQDAFFAPEGYDLASFTRDVRRSVSETDRLYLEEKFAHQLGLNLRKFQLQVALLAIQRNLRILGVFARLIRDGKPKYVKFMPRVWAYLMTDLKRPELVHLYDVVRSNIRNPADNFKDTK